MYAERYIVARSLNHCFHGNTTVHPSIVGIYVAANNIKVLRVAMELQQ